MRINFVAENFGKLKFVGSYTVIAEYAKKMKEKGIKVEINSFGKNFDLVHFHSFGPVAILYAEMLKKKGIPTVLSAHSLPSCNKENVAISSTEFWENVYKPIYNLFDYIIAISPFCKRELKEMGIKKPTHLIPLGINLKEWKFNAKSRKKFRKEYGIAEREKLVLNVGQTTPGKGLYEFIEIAEKMPEYKFMWAGDTAYSLFSADYLKAKKILKEKHGNLIFTGNLDRKKIKEAYSAADLFLFPSFRETFGMVILEAAAHSVPVIARELEVYKGLFGKSIIYAKNKKEFVEKIEKIFEGKNAEKYSKKSKELAKKYDMNKSVKEMIALYKKITK